MPIGNQDDPISAVFVDRSGRSPRPYRPLSPLLVTKAEIDDEIERLCDGPFRGSRRVEIVNPALTASGSLYPAVTVSLNVLLPGERTRPHRHNSSVVNFCIQGAGTSVIGGREVAWSKYDTWTTPPWMVHQHLNDTDELQVRLSYSNSGLLDLLGVHVVEETPRARPQPADGRPGGGARAERPRRDDRCRRRRAAHLRAADLARAAVPAAAVLAVSTLLRERLRQLRSLGQEYKGRRLFLMYDRTTGRSQGTTSTFFATITMRPAGIVDEPHRHTSAAVNYIFQGRGWSIVGGQRYEWGAGDLMLTAPGWMNHGHASHEGEDVYELTIQDSPLQIAIGSLLWVENLKDERTEALGVTKGYETNRNALVAGA